MQDQLLAMEKEYEEIKEDEELWFDFNFNK
jgi:hypothetical protein